MHKDKIKVYFLEILLFIILFFALFVQNIFTRVILSIFLIIYMFFTVYGLKKRKTLSIYNKQVIILMLAFAFIYVVGFYLMGIYFGYYSSTIKLSLWSLFKYIIPYTIIIICSEIIRYVFLSQKIKGSQVLAFVDMVLIDLIVYSGVYDITTLDKLLVVVGFVFFASVACNLLYNYISTRFGYKAIIIYRLITVLYVYFIPFTPDVYIFFRSILRMIYPYLIYVVLEYSYAKNNKFNSYLNKKRNVIGTAFLLLVVVVVTALVSCQFRYGLLVIGSGSMTGTINKGDAVLFESYDIQDIKEGQIIIFEKENMKVVHRVIDIKKINGEIRYFTKGDANQLSDDWYVLKDEIIGVYICRVAYIGYPTLWLRDIFV